MEKDEFKRNVPSDEGRQNDPHIRDESAVQPGVNTLSTSKNDEANQQLTKTGASNFDESADADGADRRFNEVGDED